MDFSERNSSEAVPKHHHLNEMNGPSQVRPEMSFARGNPCGQRVGSVWALCGHRVGTVGLAFCVFRLSWGGFGLQARCKRHYPTMGNDSYMLWGILLETWTR